jgi:two-component system chemotaxis sensor kinase CheA
VPSVTDAPQAAAPAAGAAVADTALRVDVDLLDKLMTLVGELVLARNQILQLAGESPDNNMANATQRLDLVTSDLQEGVMKTRMQPIGNIWGKFPRVVRDVATLCGKQVRIEMEGKETDLDKTIIEAIKDPLTHIVRNSVDHGIERPEVRVAAGKPAEGVLRLRAFHEGGQINIEIADDGAGIDPARIKAAALAKGVATAEQLARMNDQEAVRLIFEAGFSTAEKVTNISGRGVGMDVVKTNIEKIGGQVDIQSRVGEGTTLRIKIPLTLAIIPALVVTSSDGARYAIPQVNLLELVRLERESGSLPIEYIQSAPFYRLRGSLLPLVYLHEQLGLTRPEGETLDAANVVVLRADGRQFGLVVDRITDSEEIVVKPLGRHFKHVPMYAGATIMGDGSVALILDVIGLAQRAGVVSQVRGRSSGAAEAAAEAARSERSSLLLFSAGTHTLMGIPLSCVTRLEEFAPHRIEYSGGQEIVQYGDEIMPLVTMWTTDASGAGPRKAIVLGVDGSHAALVVDRIVDIVHDDYAIKPIASGTYLLGSAVVQDRVAEIVDVNAVVGEARRILAGAAA